MSASLVGSEMCIRDRASCVHFLHVWACGARETAAPLDLPHSSHGVEAVSYTHLTLPTICSV
eukprot:10780671-Alexandrium_andersonii.AAC.1